MQIRNVGGPGRWFPFLFLALITVTSGLYAAAPRSIRVLMWDEQQPEQKRAYGEKFLGETIAAHPAQPPRFATLPARDDATKAA